MSPRRLQMLMLAVFCVAADQSVQAQTSACRLGRDLRTALGFGVLDLAALNVDQQAETSIISAATSFCDENRETIEPLIVAYKSARDTAFHNYELGADTTASDQAVLDAIADLESEASEVISTMSGFLTGDQQTLQDQIAGHHLVETSLAALDLTSEQETAIRSAQRTRDAVMRHGKDRKDDHKVAMAQTDFETALSGILTESQVSKRSSNASTIRQHIDDVQSVQDGLCQ